MLFVCYPVDYLATPVGYGGSSFSVSSARYFSRENFSGKSFRLCASFINFFFSGCRNLVFCYVIINSVQIFFGQPVPTDEQLLFLYQFSTSFSTSSCDIKSPDFTRLEATLALLTSCFCVTGEPSTL
jgi:hypothetical protein